MVFMVEVGRKAGFVDRCGSRETLSPRSHRMVEHESRFCSPRGVCLLGAQEQEIGCRESGASSPRPSRRGHTTAGAGGAGVDGG